MIPRGRVTIIPVLGDNYSYVVEAGDTAAIIDPGEADPLISYLDEHHAKPELVLITHYHRDHIGGISALQKKYTIKVVGPAPPLLELDVTCSPGDPIVLGSVQFDVLDTAGHSFPHVTYYEPSRRWLFSGDCLFGAGCGRIAGSAAATMWKSIQSLAALPDDTLMFFGHEYTLSNLAFAAAAEPGNSAIHKRRQRVELQLKKGEYSSPSTLAEEKATNPFLRVHSSEIRQKLNMMDASDLAVFTALRAAKNSFA